MNFKGSWNFQRYEEFLAFLNSNQDKKYQEFHKKSIGCNNVIGVRTPILKNIAKEISQGEYQQFIKLNTANFYETIMIEGFLYSFLKIPFEELVTYLDRYLKKINCWAHVDLTVSNLKIFKEEKRLLFNKYSPYLDIYEALGWAYDRIKNKTPIDGTYPIISLLGENIENIKTKIRNNSYLKKTIDSLLEDVLPILFITYTLGEIFNLIENYELDENWKYIIKSVIGIKSNSETNNFEIKKITKEIR